VNILYFKTSFRVP